MLRKVLSVIAGVATAFVLLMLLESLLWMIFPPPPGTDIKSPESVRAIMQSMPFATFLLQMANYALISFAGGLVASLIAGRSVAMPALIVGVLVMASGIWDSAEVGCPLWFTVISALEFIPFAYAGFLLVRKKA